MYVKLLQLTLQYLPDTLSKAKIYQICSVQIIKTFPFKAKTPELIQGAELHGFRPVASDVIFQSGHKSVSVPDTEISLM